MRVDRLAIFYEITALWLEIKSQMLLLCYFYRLQMVVVVVGLFDDHLIGVSLDQMVWTVSDLLIFECKLLVFTVLSIHLTKALLKCIDGCHMYLVAVSDLGLWCLPSIK